MRRETIILTMMQPQKPSFLRHRRGLLPAPGRNEVLAIQSQFPAFVGNHTFHQKGSTPPATRAALRLTCVDLQAGPRTLHNKVENANDRGRSNFQWRAPEESAPSSYKFQRLLPRAWMNRRVGQSSASAPGSKHCKRFLPIKYFTEKCGSAVCD